MAHEERKHRKHDSAGGAAGVVVFVIIALLVVKMSKSARPDVALSCDCAANANNFPIPSS